MTTNHLAMSDEDFLKQSLPETGGTSSVETTQENTDTNEDPSQQETKEEVSTEETKETPENQEVKTDDKSADNADDLENKEDKPDSSGSDNKQEQKPEVKVEEKPAQEAPNYEALYQEIMKPFNANGKTIELKDPKEAIQLMQMGANYTRKLQELAPHRKMIRMLENNGLLDESKISFLIDLDKKNPEAIKKLLKDSGIDPLDIDVKEEPAYQAGSHRVSDQEVKFHSQLDELSSTDKGKGTLVAIDKDWDQASKDMLWDHPEVMAIIHTQRENGVYTKITEEMDRQNLLGQIAPTTSFLQAYKEVGDQLFPAGKTEQAPAKQEIAPVVTRTAAPKPTVDNDDKASATSPTRASPGKAKVAVNYLSMSDEDFLKSANFEGRV